MNDFYTVVANKAIDTLIPILIVWLVALAHLAIAWLQKRNLLSDAEYIQKQIETKQGWAYDAVLAVEDAYKELGGPDKLQKAIGKVVAKAQAHGFPYSLDEVEDYVRTAYQEVVAGVGQALVTQQVAALTAAPGPAADAQLQASDTLALVSAPATADSLPQAPADVAPAQAAPDATVQVANDTATPAQDASAAEVASAPDPLAAAQAAAQDAQAHAQAAADAAARAAQAVAQVTQPAS